jgi:hypothetical protein
MTTMAQPGTYALLLEGHYHVAEQLLAGRNQG